MLLKGIVKLIGMTSLLNVLQKELQGKNIFPGESMQVEDGISDCDKGRRGVQRAASTWRTLGIRSCRTFCSDLA